MVNGLHLQSTTEVMLDSFVGLKYRFRGSQWWDVYQGRGIKLSYEAYDACAAGLWSCAWGMCCARAWPCFGSGRCRVVVWDFASDAPCGSEHASCYELSLRSAAASRWRLMKAEAGDMFATLRVFFCITLQYPEAMAVR